jgi:hypothetical protein
MTFEDLKSALVLLFGVSGWGVAIVKLFTDLREDKRKARDDLRKEREELRSEKEAERKEREYRIKMAEQFAPFIAELNSGDILVLYKEFVRNGECNQDGSRRTETQQQDLMNYPAKLEEIGALMLAGKFSQSDVYDKFGEEILTCERANKVWKSEDKHYWGVFQLLASAMKQEQIMRDRGTSNAAGPQPREHDGR